MFGPLSQLHFIRVCYFSKATIPFSTCTQITGIGMPTLFSFKHFFTDYNLTVRPSPAANYNALFNYSAQVCNMQKTMQNTPLCTIWGYPLQLRFSWCLQTSDVSSMVMSIQFIKYFKVYWGVDITNGMHSLSCNVAFYRKKLWVRLHSALLCFKLQPLCTNVVDTRPTQRF